MKTLHKILVFAGISLMVTACGKKLELLPLNTIPEEGAFRNLADLERGMLGVHSTFNGSYDDQIYANSLYSDEAALPGENNTGRGVIASRWQIDPSTDEIGNAWFSYYYGIDRANRIIAVADTMTAITPADKEQLNRLKAEALGLRAFGHLQLLINYSESYDPNALGIPYMEKSEISNPARSTVGEVFTKIYADLDAAITLMPASVADVARITAAGLNAIKARAALYRKDWPTAITASTAAINKVPLATIAEYPGIWTDANNKDVIWKQKRVTGQTRIGAIYYDESQKLIMYAASEKLRSTFDPVDDVRYDANVFERGTDRFSVGKYIGGSSGEPGRADIKVFRTSEMYLIRAEAYAESNPANLAAAANDINDLRTVRIDGYTDQTFANKQAVIDAVMLERYKELAFEGHRLFDLRRKLLPVNRGPNDVEYAFGAVNLLPAARTYYFPIPQDEILANKNMLQNPTYRN